tara:strand:- start:20050 stop:20637 length:588 start_codon:yes stop_codon:yes gene_type:complete
MATQFSKLGIMNAALTEQGLEKLASINDGSPEFEAMNGSWPLVVEAELEDGHYNFSRQQEFLQTRSDGAFGYADAYLLPQNTLHVRHVWSEASPGVRTFIEFSTDAERVYVDSEAGCFAELLISQDPALWGANFARGIQMKMEAVLLRLQEDPSSEMEQAAEVYFQKARTISSKARTPKKLNRSSRIADARFGRG